MNNLRLLKDNINTLNLETDNLDKYLKKYKSLEKKIDEYSKNYNVIKNEYNDIKSNKQSQVSQINSFNIEKMLQETNYLMNELNNINLEKLDINKLQEILGTYKKFKIDEENYNNYINNLKINIKKVN